MKLCSIASGSSGNCIFAGSETTSLLIDAGISGKRVEAGLAVLDRSAKELDGILVTHEHSDHIQGLGVLARRYGIPIYATDGTIQAMQQTKSLGKFPEGIFHTIHADDTFTLGDIAVHPFTISHDAAEPVGYRILTGWKEAAVAQAGQEEGRAEDRGTKFYFLKIYSGFVGIASIAGRLPLNMDLN